MGLLRLKYYDKFLILQTSDYSFLLSFFEFTVTEIACLCVCYADMLQFNDELFTFAGGLFSASECR